jgi:hypothetical protein
MEATAQSQLQRAELEAVLASGIFNRAPNLSHFLTYICERYFEGAADQIKEYNIAVEALGRPADFDQKKDSIVRVEAHRLRKRLAEYYASSGLDHPIQIHIPNGQYAPRFIDKHSQENGQTITEQPEARWPEFAGEQATAPPLEVLPVFSAAIPPQRPKPSKSLAIALIATAVFLTAILLWANRRGKPLVGSSAPSEIWKGNSTEPVNSEFRMLAGYHGQPFTDRQGHQWLPDSYFYGGHSVLISPFRVIEGLPDPNLPETMREGGNFRYEIPLRPGTYELHIFFAETSPGRSDSTEGDDLRAFRVAVNGETKLDLFDAMSEAGAPNRLQVRVFKDVGPAKDGKLHIEFTGQNGDSMLNAIEVLSSAPDRIRPIRIVTRKNPITDAEGRVWAADEFAIGGHLVERTSSVLNSRQKNLFEGERFGHFSYHLPAAPGKYRLTLYFAETYFGSRIPNSPPYQKGARLFNVFVNGVAILRDFDIGDAAGGPNRGIEKSFDNLEPNAQGLIVLEFSPLKNYACVNAIELEETG